MAREVLDPIRELAHGRVPTMTNGTSCRRRTLRYPSPVDPPKTTPRLVIVMPAYNAAQTLERTYADIPHDRVERIILVDDVRGTRRSRSPGTWASTSSSTARTRLRREPEDVLRRRARGRRRHRGHAPSRLPVRRDAHPGPRRADRRRRARPDARQPLPGRPAGRRDAALEVRQQPVPDRRREPRLRAPPVRVPHRLGAYSRHPLETIPYQLNSDDFVFDQELIAQVVAAGMAGGSARSASRRATSTSVVGGFQRASSTGSRRCASSRATPAPPARPSSRTHGPHAARTTQGSDDPERISSRCAPACLPRHHDQCHLPLAGPAPGHVAAV